MRILLVRHGSAVDPYATSSDETRWLTETGRRRVRNVARALVDRGLEPTAIYTSPLVRAVQTAEILAGAPRDFFGPLHVLPALSPDHGTTAQALAPLDRTAEDALVFFVGHEPKIRVLAGHLAGIPRFPAFQAGAACLIEHDGKRGRFEWMMDPETTELARAVEEIAR
ncbi:MAG: histidine phosphatase family protein [Polyangiaceae bacterium]|nr:histidine phosphatase family protein [Polyangiaceae bacterium]